MAGLSRLGVAICASVGDQEDEKEALSASPMAETYRTSARIYSLRERFGSALGIDGFSTQADAYWFPQYNTPWILPRPSVVTVHDLIQLRYNQKSYGGWAKVKAARLVMENALRQAARIVCVSETTSRDLAELDGSLVDKIRIIKNGVGSRWSDPSFKARQQVRQLLGGVPYLLSVSMRKPHKNQILLLRLLDKIHDRCPHHLVLAGPTTPEWERIFNAWAASSPAFTRVHDLGQVDDELLSGLYNGAALFLLPSLYEGFGLPALEAMMAGVPTLVSNRGALPEIVGEASLVLDPLDLDAWVSSVASLLSQPKEAAELRRRGIAHAQAQSWTRQTERLYQVFEEVV